MDPAFEVEDELSSPVINTASRRVTPRQAQKRRASSSAENDSENETPYDDLRKLARTLRPASTSVTPDTRGAFSNSRQAIGRYPRPVPAKRSAPSTPHAIRALEERRRAVLTPSRERRRSGRQERDSPRNVLRALSRVLAETKRTELRGAQASTKEAADEADSDDDELQDDFEANRPRLSLPIDEDQDDSLQLPPQISAVLEEDLTQKSVEMPRRAFADQSLLRDATRASDVFPLTPDQKSGITREALLRRASSPGMSIVVGDESILQSHRQGDNTEDLRHLVFAREGASSDAESPIKVTADQQPDFEDSTFRFDIPLDVPEVEEAHGSGGHSDSQDESEAEVTEPEFGQAEEPELELEFKSAPLDQVPVDKDRRPSVVDMGQSQALDTTIRPALRAKRKPKIVVRSRHGIEVPSLPMGVVKSTAISFLRPSGRKKAKLNKDALAAFTRAGDWFFEQVAEDLEAYSKHAGRKTIEESDAVALMRRQKLLNAGATPFSLAQKFLPRELLQELRMPPPNDEKKRVRRAKKTRFDVDEDDDEDEEDGEA